MNKEKVVFKTGDIVKLKSDEYPMISHIGIVVVEDENNAFIYHNTPTMCNEYNGNIVCEPIKNWLNNRIVLSVQKSGLDKDMIIELSNDLATEPYDVFMWNCEHYISYLKNGVKKSPQIAFFILLLVLFLVFWLINKK